MDLGARKVIFIIFPFVLRYTFLNYTTKSFRIINDDTVEAVVEDPRGLQ